MQNDLKMGKTLRLYQAFQIFFSLLLWVPVFFEYQQRMGVSTSDIFKIQSFYYLAFCIFELPTGWAADRWGYRTCMIWGAFVLVLANSSAGAWTSMWGFLFHFTGVALARSLISGASSAYLYALLSQVSATDRYAEIEGRARAWGLAARMLGWASVGWMMQWQVRLPYVLTAGFALLAGLCAVLLPRIEESHLKRKILSGIGWRDLFRVVVAFRYSSALLLASLQGLALFVLSRLCMVNLFQPILLGKGVATVSHGFWMSVLTLFEATGSAYPRAWVPTGWLLSRANLLWGMTLVFGVSVVGMAMGNAAAALISLCVFSWATGVAYPVQKQAMNEAITENLELAPFRALVLSCESLFDRAICAGIAAGMGYWIESGRLSDFLVIAGSLTLCFALLGMATIGVRKLNFLRRI